MASQSTTSLPQGFSIYQPMLGAPLQFFPALGTKQLDDLVNAFLPGPASIKEKRANVSVDFLEYAQRTGQSFKFYPVLAFTSATASPSISSVDASPLTPTWDWTNAGASTSSRSSMPAASRKASTSSSSRQQTAADFSHIPGMKIMTKDGVDVTNTAGRGSKTKEQRDHAHLMRIIKACDSCKKKKIRCDPSHKKRGASQAAPQSVAKPSKKARTVSQDRPVQPPAPRAVERLATPAVPPPIDYWSPLSATPELEPLDFSMTTATEPWDEFVNFPDAGLEPEYDFFYDPEGYLSPQVSSSFTSDSLSLPISPQLPERPPTGTDCVQPEIQDTLATAARSSRLEPWFATIAGDTMAYTDFNLYSPRSSFSEDERMVSVASNSPPDSAGESASRTSRTSPQTHDMVHQDHSPFGGSGWVNSEGHISASPIHQQPLPAFGYAAYGEAAEPGGEQIQQMIMSSAAEAASELGHNELARVRAQQAHAQEDNELHQWLMTQIGSRKESPAAASHSSWDAVIRSMANIRTRPRQSVESNLQTESPLSSVGYSIEPAGSSATDSPISTRKLVGRAVQHPNSQTIQNVSEDDLDESRSTPQGTRSSTSSGGNVPLLEFTQATDPATRHAQQLLPSYQPTTLSSHARQGPQDALDMSQQGDAQSVSEPWSTYAVRSNPAALGQIQRLAGLTAAFGSITAGQDGSQQSTKDASMANTTPNVQEPALNILGRNLERQTSQQPVDSSLVRRSSIWTSCSEFSGGLMSGTKLLTRTLPPLSSSRATRVGILALGLLSLFLRSKDTWWCVAVCGIIAASTFERTEAAFAPAEPLNASHNAAAAVAGEEYRAKKDTRSSFRGMGRRLAMLRCKLSGVARSPDALVLARPSFMTSELSYVC